MASCKTGVVYNLNACPSQAVCKEIPNGSDTAELSDMGELRELGKGC